MSFLYSNSFLCCQLSYLVVDCIYPSNMIYFQSVIYLCLLCTGLHFKALRGAKMSSIQNFPQRNLESFPFSWCSWEYKKKYLQWKYVVNVRHQWNLLKSNSLFLITLTFTRPSKGFKIGRKVLYRTQMKKLAWWRLR